MTFSCCLVLSAPVPLSSGRSEVQVDGAAGTGTFQADLQLSFVVVLCIILLPPPLRRWAERVTGPDPMLPGELLPRRLAGGVSLRGRARPVWAAPYTDLRADGCKLRQERHIYSNAAIRLPQAPAGAA